MSSLAFDLAADLGGDHIVTAVKAPQPGDPTYVDHVALALARLVDQFKVKKL